MRLGIALIVALAACGGSPPHTVDADRGDNPFADTGDFKPRSFSAEVTGAGRPIIFIPGLGCPGEVWADTVARLGDDVQAHVLTLAGFAGTKPIKGALSATVRKELVRYIRAHKLKAPILVGHSLGGFIAYWVAATAPDLIGGAIVVDAGPALADSDVETGRVLRNMWAQAGDDEIVDQVRAAYTGMTTDPKKIEPFIDAIAHSDRQTMGDAIYELVTTDLTDQLALIRAPVLLILADGGYQQLYKKQVTAIPDHEVVVLAGTRHFVMFDDPKGFTTALEQFLANHGR